MTPIADTSRCLPLHRSFSDRASEANSWRTRRVICESQNRKLCMISPYAPGYFSCGVDVKAYAGAVSFFAKQGYAEVYRPIAMEIALWDFAIPEWVQKKHEALIGAGVKVEPYRSELTLPLLQFAADEFMGDWVRYCRETMGKIQLGENPARLMIAHENGNVLGFSHFDNEQLRADRCRGRPTWQRDRAGADVPDAASAETRGFQNRVVSLVGRQDRGADLQRGGV